MGRFIKIKARGSERFWSSEARKRNMSFADPQRASGNFVLWLTDAFHSTVWNIRRTSADQRTKGRRIKAGELKQVKQLKNSFKRHKHPTKMDFLELA